MEYAYAAAGAIIVVFIVLILQKRPKSNADYLLILVNLFIALFLLADVLVMSGKSSFNLILQNAVPLFLFPTFTFYVLQFLYPGKSLSQGWKLLFIPGLLFLIYALIDHYWLGNYPTAESLEEHFNHPGVVYQIFFKGSQILFIMVIVYLIRQLRLFEDRLKDGFSYIETVDLGWLLNFSYIYLGSIIITFILFLGSNLGISGLAIEETFAVVYGILILSLFYLNFQGIKHYSLAQVYEGKNHNYVEEPPVSAVPINNLPNRSGNAALFKRVEQFLREEECYLTPKYGLGDLASDLNESTHQVSESINTNFQGSFYDLINSYRVRHFKELLRDPGNSKYTILHLGLESGFNSKASMNRIFRSISGMTPRQYRDQHLKDLVNR